MPDFVSHSENLGQNSLCLWFTTPSKLTTDFGSGARDERLANVTKVPAAVSRQRVSVIWAE
jgi:hypothetical protein